MIPLPRVRLQFLAAACLALTVRAQTPAPGTTKDDEDVVKEGPVDPFTKGEPKGMQALGIVAYGPLDWADGKRTTDLEKVLGENRILWVETAHFRIGCNLGNTVPPAEPDARKLLNAELQRLSKKWSKVPARGSKVSAWTRLHLYVQRCEELYADVAAIVGHDDASGTFLGQRGKFPVLLLQKKSDLARYLDAFQGRQSQQSQCVWFSGTGQNGIVLTAEGEDMHPETGVHAHLRFLLVQAFVRAGGGAPYWLENGFAHWYERQVPTDMIFCAIREDEHVDPMGQHLWHDRAKARARRDSLVVPLRSLFEKTDLGFFDHVQAWSRVDHLLAVDREKFGQLLVGMRGGANAAKQEQVLAQCFGLDPETCDAKWREWVAKNYK